MNEQINDAWDSVNDKEFVNFDKVKNNNVINITFIEGTPSPKVSPQFGTLQYNFEVIDNDDPGTIKIFSPSSQRLMRMLKELRPLENKSFMIQRKGEGFQTTFVVEPGTEQTQIEE